ncbi:MAG: CPBP family intramembrane metalloprotease [Chloroflexi bacterium]|nr:MAG: CPBP family intramembrane metalloprotease [Chloroflexota bacterium]
MSETSLGQLDQRQVHPLKGVTGAIIFAVVTVVLTVGVILLPLPDLVGPILVVFIPFVISTVLLLIEGGWRQVRKQILDRRTWGISLKWAAISIGVAAALRIGASLIGMIAGYSFQPAPFTPLLLATFIFAAGEEIGWRGYALPRAMNRFSPLAASLLLGIPWALLHLPLTLPGKMLAGAPPAATLLVMMGLSILVTWVYLGAGSSVLAATLLHGGQNALVILNNGIPTETINWIMAGIYVVAALLVILLTRGRLGASRNQTLAQD